KDPDAQGGAYFERLHRGRGTREGAPPPAGIPAQRDRASADAALRRAGTAAERRRAGARVSTPRRGGMSAREQNSGPNCRAGAGRQKGAEPAGPPFWHRKRLLRAAVARRSHALSGAPVGDMAESAGAAAAVGPPPCEGFRSRSGAAALV